MAVTNVVVVDKDLDGFKAEGAADEVDAVEAAAVSNDGDATAGNKEAEPEGQYPGGGNRNDKTPHVMTTA